MSGSDKNPCVVACCVVWTDLEEVDDGGVRRGDAQISGALEPRVVAGPERVWRILRQAHLFRRPGVTMGAEFISEPVFKNPVCLKPIHPQTRQLILYKYKS